MYASTAATIPACDSLTSEQPIFDVSVSELFDVDFLSPLVTAKLKRQKVSHHDTPFTVAHALAPNTPIIGTPPQMQLDGDLSAAEDTPIIATASESSVVQVTDDIATPTPVAHVLALNAPIIGTPPQMQLDGDSSAAEDTPIIVTAAESSVAAVTDDNSSLPDLQMCDCPDILPDEEMVSFLLGLGDTTEHTMPTDVEGASELSVPYAQRLAHAVASVLNLPQCKTADCHLYCQADGDCCRQCNKGEVADNTSSSAGCMKVILSKREEVQDTLLVRCIVEKVARGLGCSEEEVAEVKVWVCHLILEESFPRKKNFFFTKLTRSDKEDCRGIGMLRMISTVFWAALFLLEMLLFCREFNEDDLFVNNLLCDDELLKMNSKDIVSLFAAIGYVCSINAQLLVNGEKTKGSMIKAVSGTHYQDLLHAICIFGFCPVIKEDSTWESLSKIHPEFSSFLEIFGKESLVDTHGVSQSLLLNSYLRQMTRNWGLPIKDVCRALCSWSGRVFILPLFLLAFGFHLHWSASSNQESLLCSHIVGAGKRATIVDTATSNSIEHPTFESFCLKASCLYETRIQKALEVIFSRRRFISLGNRMKDEIEDQTIRHCSFNFGLLEGDIRALSCLIVRMSKNPECYMNDPLFRFLFNQLQTLHAEVVQMSGNDAVATAKSTACIQSESLVSSDNMPLLRMPL